MDTTRITPHVAAEDASRSPCHHAAEKARISVIIPAKNEERSIGLVLDALPRDLVKDIIVVDNGSRDRTAIEARRHGARVVYEAWPGYGAACLRGIANLCDTDIVVFLDADFSDFPEELPALVEPILNDEADMVIGSRLLGREADRAALLPQARFGNWLAAFLIKRIYGHAYTDLGPFRAIRHEALRDLEMRDRDFGWTVEMQVRAVKSGLRIKEVPVRYRKRVGSSKITGTVKGTVLAGVKILWTIFKLWVKK